jgi:deoxyribodipyrimidine photo-lyase
MTATEQDEFEPTRAAGLQRLARFAPRADDEHYAGGRSRDQERSGLSPWLAHRLVLESEITRAVVDAHGWAGARAFLTELARNTYYRGWLEHRPMVWSDYRTALASGLGRVEQTSSARQPYLKAVLGETGIDCFDAWAHELVERGYLKHRARQAFASIWIFTLKLPWVLGADFFNRHLLDGDVAVNVTTWRSVAGLHDGHPFVVRPGDAIDLLGPDRDPGELLAATGRALVDPSPRGPRVPDPVPRVVAGQATGAVLTAEDLCPEASPLRALELQSVFGGWARRIGDAYHLSARVIEFRKRALDDALVRCGRHLGVRTQEPRPREWLEDAIEWVENEKLARVVALQPDVGPWRDLLSVLASALNRRGIAFAWVQREWDRLLFGAADGDFDRFVDHFWTAKDQLIAVD